MPALLLYITAYYLTFGSTKGLNLKILIFYINQIIMNEKTGCNEQITTTSSLFYKSIKQRQTSW